MYLPAGKKLFVITTLIFSIILTFFKYITRKFQDYKDRKTQEEQETGEKVVVAVK